jgi:hypothetical protein
MDTEEMYERGVADADRGEPHPFYYQHYYHYRRGYDKARRQLRRPRVWDGGRTKRGWLLAAAILCIIGIGSFVALRSRAQPTTATRTLGTSPTLSITTTLPERSPIFPTAAAVPTPAGVHIGGTAQITNTEGKVLRGRQQPNLKSPAQAAFKEGEQVRILEGPVTADGYTWWRIEGSGGAGWSAQQSQEGVVWLLPLDK